MTFYLLSKLGRKKKKNKKKEKKNNKKKQKTKKAFCLFYSTIFLNKYKIMAKTEKKVK